MLILGQKVLAYHIWVPQGCPNWPNWTLVGPKNGLAPILTPNMSLAYHFCFDLYVTCHGSCHLKKTPPNRPRDPLGSPGVAGEGLIGLGPFFYLFPRSKWSTLVHNMFNFVLNKKRSPDHPGPWGIPKILVSPKPRTLGTWGFVWPFWVIIWLNLVILGQKVLASHIPASRSQSKPLVDPGPIWPSTWVITKEVWVEYVWPSEESFPP
jgi:hypothetical protein